MDDGFLTSWVTTTARSNMPLYAVLANTGQSQAIKNYYQYDGSETPYGLYVGTPYAEWFEVMPMLVPLRDDSPFLEWIATTEHRDWGFLARSPFPFSIVVDYLQGLTKVFMPTNKAVFFRYWDGHYLAKYIRWLGDNWGKVLPAFPFYWINGQDFTVPIAIDAMPQHFPWWQVPPELVEVLNRQDTQPVIDSTLLILRENYPYLYWQFSEAVLMAKIRRLFQLTDGQLEGFIEYVVRSLTEYGDNRTK